MNSKPFISGLFVLLASFYATLPICAADPLLEQIDVFTSSRDGYFAYRIPAIETAPDGSLLAFAEARKHHIDDPGFHGQDIDLVMKRSTDAGKTWSAMKIIEDPGEKWSAANPATVLDRQTGRIWLFYLRGKPDINTYNARPGTNDIQILARTSDDNGLTWSAPIDLTTITRDMTDPKWRCTVPGPGGGIQARDGRLVIPMWRFRPFSVFVISSADHGRTWHRSSIVPNLSGDECQLVELSDGRILLDARQQRGPTRLQSITSDFGRNWSKPRPGQNVSEVACAIERVPFQVDGKDQPAILWTGPRGPDRTKLVVRISHDNAETFPHEHLLSPGRAAYSDLTVLNDKSIGVLFERGADRDYQFITFTRFNQTWLQRPAP